MHAVLSSLPILPFLLALQETAAPAGQGAAPAGPAAAPKSLFGGPSDFLLMGGLFVVIFYFLMWRPQARERKAREAMFKGIKKGDRVLLSCGLVADVAALTDQDVLVKVDDKDPRRLRFRKYAIQGVLNQEAEAPAPAPDPSEAAAK